MKMKLLLLAVFLLLAVLVGFNWQTVIARITMGQEVAKLRQAALGEPDTAEMVRVREDFAGNLTLGFWDAVILNSDGEVSAGPAFGAVDYRVEGGGVVLRHRHDSNFEDKGTDGSWDPAPARYNNITLVSSQAFLPTDTHDVVVRFQMKASPGYYGSAGLVLQPQGLLGAGGKFNGPFNLFGVMFIGSESRLQGVNGAVCTMTLNWIPVFHHALPDINIYAYSQYIIRLRRIENQNWKASITVNGLQGCETTMPSLGAIVMHIWSDNYLFVEQPRQLFHIWPPMPVVEFQNGGGKEVWFGPIEIGSEAKQ